MIGRTLIALLWCAAAGVTVLRAEEMPELVREVQGHWTRQVTTPRGPVTMVKEHKANGTTVIAYDEQRNVLYEHRSEFKVEQTGRVKLFTFFNRRVIAGPEAGTTSLKPERFLYRVTKGRFIEVHGLLDDDESSPILIIWERVRDNANL